jgi:nicotinamidase-related amidase
LWYVPIIPLTETARDETTIRPMAGSVVSTDMEKPVDHAAIVERLLAGTPSRVLEGFSGNDPDVRAAITENLEALSLLARSLDPVPPPPALRERVAAAVAALPPYPRRSALLVVDMLRDHLTPGAPLEVPRARAIVPAVKHRVDAAHAAGEPVLYLIDHHEPGDPELLAWPAHNTSPPLDDLWPEFIPQPHDAIVTHRSYSGFFETDLHDRLRALDVNTLVITGCITEIHVFATAIDALQRGYRVEVPRACQAGASPQAEHLVLSTLTAMAPTMPAG